MIGLVAFTRTFTGTDGEVTEGDKIAVLAFGMLEYGPDAQHTNYPRIPNSKTHAIAGAVDSAIPGLTTKKSALFHFNP